LNRCVIVDPLPVARFVAEQFAWGGVGSMTPVAEGAMGRVWRLDTTTGPYAVKELYWAADVSAEDALVARQVLFCDLARAAGVAAPASLRTASGQYVIELPPRLGGRLIRAYEWIDGRSVTSAEPGSAAWVGATAAAIEGLAVPPGDQPVDPWSYRAPSRETWDAVVSRCEEAQQPWADQLRRMIPRFVALGDLMRPPDSDQLIVIHTDFQPQNVLVDDDGRFVLLDWDDSGPSTRSRALAQLINNWHLHGTTVDHDGIRVTLTSYRAAGGTGRITELADFGDAICGYLNYVHGQAELSLDHRQPSNLRIDAGHRLPDLLNPPPLSVYDEAIRAAT
jgi:Ser/Thr protein kinase RdoA (MazF antagonist)